MNEINKLRDLIEDKFKDDPLLEQIQILNLNEYLFPDELLSKLNTTTTYSLTDAAGFLGIKDYNLRNYQNRHHLVEYIQPERMGPKLLRYDYKSIIKFHMIFILVNKGNKSATDIASYAGTKVETGHASVRTNRETPINDPFSLSPQSPDGNEMTEKRLDSVEKMIFLMNWERIVEQSKSNWENSMRLIKDWEKEVAILGREIENLELRKEIKKQDKKLVELVKGSHKKLNSENNYKVGFLGLLFKNKSESIDYDNVIDQVASSVEGKLEKISGLESINKAIEKLQEKKDKLTSEKQELLEVRDQEEKKYLDLKGQLEKLKLQLSQEEDSGNLVNKMLAASSDLE